MLISRQTLPFNNTDFYKLYASDNGDDPITNDSYHILVGNHGGKLCLLIKKLLFSLLENFVYLLFIF